MITSLDTASIAITISNTLVQFHYLPIPNDGYMTNDLTDQRNLDDEVMCQLLKKYNFCVVNDIYSILTK